MLNVGPWNRLPLTIRWLKQEYQMEFDVEQQPPTHMPIVYGLLNKKKPKKRNQEECEESKDVCNYKCIECSKRIKVQPVFLKAANGIMWINDMFSFLIAYRSTYDSLLLKC